MFGRTFGCGRRPRVGSLLWVSLVLGGAASVAAAEAGDRAAWLGDLTPIERGAWTASDAAHLLERAGFGATPADVQRLLRLGPKRAVRELSRPRRGASAFVHSGIFDAGLDPFPPSRPATTNAAKRDGRALGIDVKPTGNRPIQPIVNKFFYWLRASRLETDRVAYWWANRMLVSESPLVEKTALFWHGHFAVNEDKVRDYRKLLAQIELFQAAGLGNFRDLLLAVARSPAMLAFLDAGVNVKDAPNENFAREIMELFTLGVGHYGEQDVREAARAFTGWNYDGLRFAFDPELHDQGAKRFLGHEGRFDGEQIIDLILAERQAADFLAAKLYRFFVRDTVAPELARELGRRLYELDYDVGGFLALLLRSKDFYSPASRAVHIKSPVELVVSTYRKLGLGALPGVPDFNVVTGSLGQRLLHPPTVAGWSAGRAWITPSLLFERGNFVQDVLFPDIGFVPPDRYPNYGGANIVAVQDRLRAGESVASATRPAGVAAGGEMAASNAMADQDEAFNTRLGSMRGWQLAIERVLPIPRTTARLDLAGEIRAAGAVDCAAVVNYFERRFLSVALEAQVRRTLSDFLLAQLGTDDVAAALSYAEEPLRLLLHTMLSLPEYQLG
ncbi:MAG: DUF1800 domain-containing protein [Pseudomonadota bacterium]